MLKQQPESCIHHLPSAAASGEPPGRRCRWVGAAHSCLPAVTNVRLKCFFFTMLLYKKPLHLHHANIGIWVSLEVQPATSINLTGVWVKGMLMQVFIKTNNLLLQDLSIHVWGAYEEIWKLALLHGDCTTGKLQEFEYRISDLHVCSSIRTYSIIRIYSIWPDFFYWGEAFTSAPPPQPTHPEVHTVTEMCAGVGPFDAYSPFSTSDICKVGYITHMQ